MKEFEQIKMVYQIKGYNRVFDTQEEAYKFFIKDKKGEMKRLIRMNQREIKTERETLAKTRKQLELKNENWQILQKRWETKDFFDGTKLYDKEKDWEVLLPKGARIDSKKGVLEAKQFALISMKYKIKRSEEYLKKRKREYKDLQRYLSKIIEAEKEMAKEAENGISE